VGLWPVSSRRGTGRLLGVQCARLDWWPGQRRRGDVAGPRPVARERAGAGGQRPPVSGAACARRRGQQRAARTGPVGELTGRKPVSLRASRSVGREPPAWLCLQVACDRGGEQEWPSGLRPDNGNTSGHAFRNSRSRVIRRRSERSAPGVVRAKLVGLWGRYEAASGQPLRRAGLRETGTARRPAATGTIAPPDCCPTEFPRSSFAAVEPPSVARRHREDRVGAKLADRSSLGEPVLLDVVRRTDWLQLACRFESRSYGTQLEALQASRTLASRAGAATLRLLVPRAQLGEPLGLRPAQASATLAVHVAFATSAGPGRREAGCGRHW
jgi:hypothetical protein